MSTTLPARAQAAKAPSAASTAPNWAIALVRRLHLLVGLLVGPLLLVAALSGLAYVLTPQLETWLYRDTLTTPSRGPALPLAEQIARARSHAGADAALAAVRPAPEPGATTRVMFRQAGLGESTHRAVFIDPVSGAVRGDEAVYGTSGSLPLRTTIDQFHRALLLGSAGRHYSELAASWLWLAALGGLALWASRAWRARGQRGHGGKDGRRGGLRRWHATLGLWLLLGLLFLSATGLTWSRYAGDHIGVLRQHYGWSTPALQTRLPALPGTATQAAAPAAPSHQHHHDDDMPPMQMLAQADVPEPHAPSLDRIDAVLGAARAAGIAASLIEIKPPSSSDRAWTVTEIDRRWPTQVDAVAVDGRTLAVTSQTRFADYPLAAKLTRWGVDLHMGVMFGWPNQLVLALLALGLATMTVWGYVLWWRRRATRTVRDATLLACIGQAPPWARALLLVVAAGLGWALPMLGASLLVLLAVEGVNQICRAHASTAGA